MVITPPFSSSICSYPSASEFHLKGEAAGVTRCGGIAGLLEKAAQAPGDHTPSFFLHLLRLPWSPETLHILQKCNFIILLWSIAEFKEEVVACKLFIYDVMFRIQCSQIPARLNL